MPHQHYKKQACFKFSKGAQIPPQPGKDKESTKQKRPYSLAAILAISGFV